MSSPTTVSPSGPTNTPLIAGVLTVLAVLFVCLLTLFLLYRHGVFAKHERRSFHPFEDPRSTRLDDRPQVLAFPVAQPSSTTPSLASSQPHKTLVCGAVDVSSQAGSTRHSDVGEQGVAGQGDIATCHHHHTGLGSSGRGITADEPRPTTHEDEEVLSGTRGVSGGDVPLQTYVPSDHSRRLDAAGPGNNTELALTSRRVDSGSASALSLSNVAGQCKDAPPAYEKAWAAERERAG